MEGFSDPPLPSDPRDAPPAAAAQGRLRVALFAGVAEAVGARWIDIPWEGGSVRDLRTRIERHAPTAAALLGRSVIALGARYAAEEDRLDVGDDVAVIPPVSGG